MFIYSITFMCVCGQRDSWEEEWGERVLALSSTSGLTAQTKLTVFVCRAILTGRPPPPQRSRTRVGTNSSSEILWAALCYADCELNPGLSYDMHPGWGKVTRSTALILPGVVESENYE